VIVPSKEELFLSLGVCAFVWFSLFSHWLPTLLQSVLFLIVLLLEGVLISAGWFLWKTAEEGVSAWPRRLGLFGLSLDTAAIAVSVFSFAYILQEPFGTVQWFVVVPTCLVFCLCGMIIGVFAPREIRAVTVLSALIWASILVSIPLAVL
jgi:hypothetical protein